MKRLILTLLFVFIGETLVFLYAQGDVEYFKKLEEFFFKKTSSKKEQELLKWQNEFISNYGEEVFDSLLARYMQTESFREKARKAYKLQQTEEAKLLREQIEEVKKKAFYYRDKFYSWRRIGLGARDLKKLAGRMVRLQQEVDYWREFYRQKYLFFKEQYNQLVKKYNFQFLGTLPFWERLEKGN